MLKKSPIRRRQKSQEQKDKERYERDKMNTFWVYCWENLPRISQLSGYRFSECNKCHYHHVFPKSGYPELKYSLTNILRVSPEEHNRIENGGEDSYGVIAVRKSRILDDWDVFVKESQGWSDEYDSIKQGGI